MRRMRVPWSLFLLLFGAPCAAQSIGTVPVSDFGFPGGVTSPPVAASAGLALSDRWLGDEPFDNPAAAPHTGAALSGMLLRVSRQDLRADNRNYDETAAFLDGAGGRVAWRARRFALALYASQPLRRREDFVYTRGELGGPVPPATIAGTADVRETRVGVALSSALGRVRLGVAGEWTQRKDRYERRETSGDPASGTREGDFSGDGFGAQIGARLILQPGHHGGLVLGAGLRFVPELTLEGESNEALLIDTTRTAFATTLASAWEGGVSARYGISDAFRVTAAFGGRASQTWSGLGVSTGPASAWRLGGEFHDVRDPWTFRFGGGQERVPGSPESSAAVAAIGLGWQLDPTVLLDVGAVRRMLARADAPTSYDDRVLVTVGVTF